MKVRKAVTLLTVLTFTLVGLTASSGYSQNIKLGYIDSQRIMAEFKEAQDAQKKLDDIVQQWRQERDQMQQQLQELQDQYQKQSLLLSEERKREREQEIQNLMAKLYEFDNQKFGAQGEVYKKQAELFEPVYQKIRDAIAKVGKDGNFTYIFDVAGGAVVYKAPNQPDLTDEVLNVLNKGVSSSGGK